MFATAIDLPLDVLPQPGTFPALRLGGRALHSRLDPRGEAAQWAAAVCADMRAGEGDVVVLFGGGWGWHAAALAARFRGPLFVHEPVAGLRAGAEAGFGGAERPWGGGAPPFRPLEGPADEVALGLLLKPGMHVHVVAHPVYARLAPGGLRQLRERVQRLASEVALYQRTARQRAASWADHNYANGPALAASHGAGHLRGVAAGLPLFLVAAGPSLDRNVAQLAAAGERGLVVVVNHALGAVARTGVRPDLVAALESLDVSNHFQVPPELHERLLLGTMAHPSLFRLPARVRYAGHIAEEPVARALLAALEEPAAIVTGGSAATMAFALASFMGADPVVLVGQDLAYTDERGYATGVRLEDMRLVRGADGVARTEHAPDQYDHTGYDVRLLEVEGWDGRPVATSAPLDAQRSWFERAIAGLPAGRRVVNATQGGARIGGAEHVPLADVLAGLPPVAEAGRVLDPRRTLDVADRRRRLKRFATARRRRMDDVLALLADGLKGLTRAAALAGDERERALDRVARVDRDLAERMKDLGEVDAYLAADEPEEVPPRPGGVPSVAETRCLYERIRGAAETVRTRLSGLEAALAAGAS
jgi:hypothetical protein